MTVAMSIVPGQFDDADEDILCGQFDDAEFDPSTTCNAIQCGPRHNAPKTDTGSLPKVGDAPKEGLFSPGFADASSARHSAADILAKLASSKPSHASSSTSPVRPHTAPTFFDLPSDKLLPEKKTRRSLAEQGIKDQDVLFGRGGGTNNHIGNRAFRQIIDKSRQEYLLARKTEKAAIARRVVALVRAQGGRWMKMDSGKWQDVGDEAAARKVSQAYREGLSNMRQNLMTQGKPASAMDSSLIKKGAVNNVHTISLSDSQPCKRRKIGENYVVTV